MRILSAIALAAIIGPAIIAPALAAAQQPASLSSLAPPPRFEDPERLAKLATAFPRIDSLMRTFAERGNVPGFAYGIVIDGKLAHVGTGGLREVASRSPVDTGTVFRIASMTKSFTAAAILQLRDAGRLSLDDPVEKHVPELAGLRYPTGDSPKITIRHLLTHSEGFPEDNPWGDQQLAATEEQLSQFMRGGIPFSTAPGTAYEYSNFGFAILGRVVANVSGMPYTRYVTERVLRPLGMHATVLEAGQVPPARLAHGYRRQDDRWLEERQLPDGSFGPMGGMLTSVNDLARWVGFMLDAWPPRDGDEGAVLGRASRREMQQVWRMSTGVAVWDSVTKTLGLTAGGYGYGLGVQTNCVFPYVVAHTGGLPGFGSLMRWLPHEGVGIVAMGNLTYTGWSGVSNRALAFLQATGAMAPRVPQPAPVLVERQRQVTQLVLQWDDALADSVAAMNLFLDESKERRRDAIHRLRLQAGDECRPEGGLVAENALRGSWRLRCARGDLRVNITLAPTEPARVQYLDVRPMTREESLAPPPPCRVP